ncbi:hypothetical protein PUR71_30225 [Streptomyces sp. SP17BM10]|uniref:hypothetical protein n=1 Tax=Streptomyces sp. SP17BM10 TaxID=3002530 RepID=UPI002E783AC8|nr:hypothetical protein [Streptomyces sp. SP17BM10]MEE1787151.1 hypothetical protein [Streptomyces sp. SP17BM10]
MNAPRSAGSTRSTSTRLTAHAVVGAPVLMALYGGIRLVPGSREPGPGWTTGHALMLAGLLLFAPILLALRRLLAPRGTVAGRLAAGAALGVAFAGLVASVLQIGIDLYVGVASATKGDQTRMFERIQAVPGVLTAVYEVGPLLFYVGLLALLVAASVGAARTLRWWSPVLMVAGTLGSMVDLAFIPLAAVCYLIALSPLILGGRRWAAGRTVRV